MQFTLAVVSDSEPLAGMRWWLLLALAPFVVHAADADEVDFDDLDEQKGAVSNLDPKPKSGNPAVDRLAASDDDFDEVNSLSADQAVGSVSHEYPRRSGKPGGGTNIRVPVPGATKSQPWYKFKTCNYEYPAKEIHNVQKTETCLTPSNMTRFFNLTTCLTVPLHTQRNGEPRHVYRFAVPNHYYSTTGCRFANVSHLLFVLLCMYSVVHIIILSLHYYVYVHYNLV